MHATTAKLLDTLRDLHGDGLMEEVYNCTPYTDIEDLGEEGPPLEEALHAWAAAGYPDVGVNADAEVERLTAELAQAHEALLPEPALAEDPLQALQVFRERFGQYYTDKRGPDASECGGPGPVGVLAEVAAERERQVAKGYTAEHDDGAEQGELAQVAGLVLLDAYDGLPMTSHNADKVAVHIMERHDRRQQLIIALALGLAEVERQDRLRARKPSTPAPAQEQAP